MSFTATDGRLDLDTALISLSAGRIVASQGVARLVVGANGAFVVVPVTERRSTSDLDAAARLAHDLAARTREVLVQHLGLAPFLDALVAVTARRCPTDQSLATLVPLDLIGDVLAEGPTQVGEQALSRIRNLLEEGLLDGWKAGIISAGATIDLCDETTTAPTR